MKPSEFGEGTVHLVASGFNKSFCGLGIEDIPNKHTSLGMCCNCEECIDLELLFLANKDYSEVGK